MRKPAIAIMSVLFMGQFASGDENADKLAKLLPSGKPAISENIAAMKTRVGESSQASTATLKEQGRDYLHVRIVREPAKAWDCQLSAPSTTEFKSGDYGLAVVVMRGKGVDKATAKAVVIFERSSAPWDKALTQELELNDRWQTFYLPFKVKTGNVFRPGEMHLGINLGYGKQSVDVAEVKCYNFGNRIDPALLPCKKITYQGREADAAWRKAAEQRIETLRKGHIVIKVVDAQGQPVENAEVKMEMLKHDFIFGSCLNLYTWAANPPRYREEFKKLFNMAVFENAMKWTNNGWEYSDKLRQCVKWLHDNDIAVRGHCLIWPKWGLVPDYLKTLKNHKTALRQTVRDHIYYEASVLRNQVTDWDVLNEVCTHDDLPNILGKEVMVEWFKTAKKAAPEQKMFINDFDILESGNSTDTAKQKKYAGIVDYLLKNGAPLEGIGFQSHFQEKSMTAPENLLKILDRFAQFKISLRITEYDLVLFDEDVQADYLRDVMTVMFSHPAADGFLMWGFWDGKHWISSAPIYNMDWSLKKSGKVYKELVFKKWWTDETVKTNRGGVAEVNGFKGIYRVTVTSAGHRKTVDSQFNKSSNSLEIMLK